MNIEIYNKRNVIDPVLEAFPRLDEFNPGDRVRLMTIIEIYRLVQYNQIISFCALGFILLNADDWIIKQLDYAEQYVKLNSIGMDRLHRLLKIRNYINPNVCQILNDYYHKKSENYSVDDFYKALVSTFCYEYLCRKHGIHILLNNEDIFDTIYPGFKDKFTKVWNTKWWDCVKGKATFESNERVYNIQRTPPKKRKNLSYIRLPDDIKNIINTRFMDKSKDSMTVYLKIKPKTDENVYDLPVVGYDDHNQLYYNCSEGNTLTKDWKKYHNDRFKNITLLKPNKSNGQIFWKTLEKPLNNKDRNLFVCAYGQSGSGKSYLLLGDEKNRLNAGLVEYTIDYLKLDHEITSIKLLPLQIYMGSVLNGFVGTRNFKDMHKIFEKKRTYKIPLNRAYKNKVYPEFNYADIYQLYPGVEELSEPDIYYPNSNIMFNPYFENSTDNIFNIEYGEYDSYDITNLDTGLVNENIRDMIEKHRPVVNTKKGVNPVSSRSHLFLIFKVEYTNGEDRLITFADFGGIEPHKKVNQRKTPIEAIIAGQKNKLVSQGIKVFRRMVQYYVNNHFKLKDKPDKYTEDNLLSNKIKKNPLIHTAHSTNRKPPHKDIISEYYNSSAMFNLIRATTGVFNNTSCDHIIFGLTHSFIPKGPYNERNYCNTTNTVLSFLSSFVPDG